MYKKMFLFLVLLSIAGSSVAIASEPNLVGWWKFDELPGDPNGRYVQTADAVVDSVGGYNGSVTGDPNSIDGYHGKAIDMWPNEVGSGGINDWVSIPTLGNLIKDLGDSTLACWINFRPTPVSNWQRISDFGTGTAVYMFWSPSAGTAATSQHRYAITVGSNGAESQVNGDRLTAGWHFVALTQAKHAGDANNTMRLYVDGVQVGQNLNSRLLPKDLGVTTQNYFGNSQWADDQLNAAMDDFMIFNKALTPAEIEEVSGHHEAWLISPANNSIDANLPRTLTWFPGDMMADVNGHKVYISSNWADVNACSASALYIIDTNSYAFTGVPDTTYYWRVVEVNGATEWKGTSIWSFAVDAEATQPQPAPVQGGILVGLSQVSWLPHGAATGQKIIFSKVFQDVNGPAAGAAGTALSGTANSWSAFTKPLDVQTDYYWRIDTQVGGNWFRGTIWSFTTAFPMNFCDPFNPGWDYYVNGVVGTIWSGVVGESNLYVMNTDANAGKLRIESSGYWRYIRGQGVLLYKEVDGPYIATVHVVNLNGMYTFWPNPHPAVTNPTGTLPDQQVGLMARLPDLSKGQFGMDRDVLDEDYVDVAFYPAWNVGNMGNAQGWEWRTGTTVRTNEDRMEFGRMWTGWNDYPNPTGATGGTHRSGSWVQLEYKGHGSGLGDANDIAKAGRFYLRWSQNGSTWFNLSSGDLPTNQRGRSLTIPLNRYGDMNNYPHQVGIFASTNYSGTVGFAEFDNFCIGRELQAKASGPSPSTGGSVDIMKAELQWAPGDLALDQNFYFGTSETAVLNATTASPEYRGNAGDGIYSGLGTPDPYTGMYSRYAYDVVAQEALVLGTTYYWRVDEVNSPTVWKGNVWSFVLLSYSVVDNFERFTSTGAPGAVGALRATWLDGYIGVGYTSWQFPNPPDPIGSSGSYAQVSFDTADGNTMTANATLGGGKSLKLYYDNDGSVAWLITLYGGAAWQYYPAPMYSEASAAVDNDARIDDLTRGLYADDQGSLEMQRDWTSYTILRIPYYGVNGNTKLNAKDKMYVGLKDGDGTLVIMNNPDTDAVLHQGWHNWYIALKDFNTANPALDMANIARVYLGVGDRAAPASGGRGAIFVDDIQLLTGTVCAPVNPANTEVTSVLYDWNFDCATNAADLRMLTRNWLAQSSGASVLPDANCVVKLDASTLALGPGLNVWTNLGTAGGVFRDPNAAISGSRPTVMMVEGVKAVMFDSNDILVCDVNAPASLTGNKTPTVTTGQGPFTAIYKVWNEVYNNDETVFNWAKRGNTNKYACLCINPNNMWGAGAYWGGDGLASGGDIRFENYYPAPHQWQTIIHIYTGGTNGAMYIITNGKMNTNRPRTLNIWPDCPMVLGGAYDGDSYLLKPWALTYGAGYKYDGALAELKIYNIAADPFTFIGMPNLATGDVPEVINFKDIAVFANSWMAQDMLAD